MNQSESIKNIASALLTFDSMVATIGKTATNPFFKNQYAPLPEILDKIKEPLMNSGLTVKQFPEGEHQLTTIIMHPASGEWISATYTMKPAKDDPQGEGSRITYQRRYALGACLGLNIDVDDDGNKASGNKKEADDKPWLDNKQFEIVLKRIQTQDYGNEGTLEKFMEKVFNTYRLKTEYRKQIDEELQSTFNNKLNG